MGDMGFALQLIVIAVGALILISLIFVGLSAGLARLARVGVKEEGPVPAAEGTESVVSQEGEGPPEGGVVAAIALALSLAQAESGRPGPRKGAPPARQTNLWAAYGRQQIMHSRGRARQQW